MADTIKLSGTYDSIEAYNILTEMQSLETTIEGYKTDAETAATNAGTSEGNALTYSTNAGNSADDASTYAGNASDSANDASGYAANAYTSETNAAASATLASQWATKTDGVVADGEYSAKYYALEAASSASDAAASEAVVAGALPLSGGTLTGTLTLADGGKALSDATVGTVVSDSISSSVSVSANTATEVTHINLTKGVWIVTGHTNITSVVATKVYGTGIETSVTYAHANDGSLSLQSSMTGTLAGQSTRILSLNATTTVYLVVWASNACSVHDGIITAVRIV